jgi:hypothetical protein
MTAVLTALKAVWAWKWQIALVLVALLAWGRGKELTGVRGQLAADKATLAQVKADGAAQAAADAKINAAAKAETHAVQTQLDSALEAHRLTSVALAERVRDYEACTVAGARHLPGGPNPAGLQQGGGGGGPNPSSARPISDALAIVVGSCQTVVDEFRACSKWAQTVKCH